MSDSSSPAAAAPPTRAFGRFELRRLLGRSAATMVWLAFDSASAREVMLTLPRLQPVDAAALARWMEDLRGAARLDHPNLAPVLEAGSQDHWPYVAVDREQGVTLGEWLAGTTVVPPLDAAGWLCDALRGLAYAHEAGVSHQDPQLHTLLINERGVVLVMALGAGGAAIAPEGPAATGRGMALDPHRLRTQRQAAARDVLACGLLLHRLLAAAPPLDEPDIALAAGRLSPLGRESLRLPWTTPLPIPEALRAIANRCTSSQERLRYQAARTLLNALCGWRDAQAEVGGGPVALLLDRLRTVGHLPALPGLGVRVARITSPEGQKTDEIAEQVLEDLALSFELLRTLNSAEVQCTQIPGNGPVLTLGRIISLIGVNGVRLAANTLREWPGPLSDVHAAQLKLVLGRVRLAGHTAQALRAPGYDAQVVYLLTALQNLGRLMLRYHFADEADQIQQLMKATPADAAAGTPELPGLDESTASCAVLGVDTEALGLAVARHWGLSDDVLHMIRRLPAGAPVRRPDGDADILRMTANAANEAIDAVTSASPATAGAAIARVAQRHARALGISTRDVADALAAARDAVRRGQVSTVAARPASARDAADPPSHTTAAALNR